MATESFNEAGAMTPEIRPTPRSQGEGRDRFNEAGAMTPEIPAKAWAKAREDEMLQ